jgi:peptide deformylase
MHRDETKGSDFFSESIGRRLRLRVHPDPLLRIKAAPVERFDKYLHLLVKKMLHFMQVHDGIGLAGPQVGVSQRIIVVGIGPAPMALANPEILHSSGQEAMVEGCLSLPGVRVNVFRKKSIAVKGVISDGKTVELSVSGLMARVIQHEIDHLNGTLISDYDVSLTTGRRQKQSA